MWLRMRLKCRKPETEPGGRRLLGGIAAAGFGFFLIKGLVWLALGGLALIGIL